jgi:hypothetical protein
MRPEYISPTSKSTSGRESTLYFLVSSVRNRNPSSAPPGHGVGSGTKQLHADETLDATDACSDGEVDAPTQFAAQDAVPAGANVAEDDAVHELQKPSRSERLAVKCLLKAFTQLLPPHVLGLRSFKKRMIPHLGKDTYGFVGFGGGAVVQTEEVAAAAAGVLFMNLGNGSLPVLFLTIFSLKPRFLDASRNPAETVEMIAKRARKAKTKRIVFVAIVQKLSREIRLFSSCT